MEIRNCHMEGGGINERQRVKNGGRGTVVLFKQVSVPQKSSADHG